MFVITNTSITDITEKRFGVRNSPARVGERSIVVERVDRGPGDILLSGLTEEGARIIVAKVAQAIIDGQRFCDLRPLIIEVDQQ